MCKPSCCPGTTSSGGLGTAVLIIVIAVIAIAAAARPIAHAATVLLHAVITITLISAAVLAGITVLAAVALIIRRIRRARPYRRQLTSRPGRRAVQMVSHPAPFALTVGERARCQALGADPDQVAQIIAAVLGGPQ